MNSLMEGTGRLAAGWIARLVRLQLAVRGGVQDSQADAEAIWPARLVHAGIALVSAGALLLAAWLRRHL